MPSTPPFSFQAKHLRSIDDLSDGDIATILELSQHYASYLKSKPSNLAKIVTTRLSQRTQINLFFENSTRTSMSFELAGKKLGADIITLPVATSSINKNEDLLDTVKTLDAMNADVMVIRSITPGILHDLSDHISCSIINAGDGAKEHPTQALLDAATMVGTFGSIKNKTIAICGDIRHSRVAGSGAKLFRRLGAQIRFVGPDFFMPDHDKFPDIERYDNLKTGLKECDVVMPLRVQFERIEETLNVDAQTLFRDYGIHEKTLEFAKPDAKIMHPGPMNRGIEIDGALADDENRSLILKQVFYGVSTRMAILDAIINRTSEASQ